MCSCLPNLIDIRAALRWLLTPVHKPVAARFVCPSRSCHENKQRHGQISGQVRTICTTDTGSTVQIPLEAAVGARESSRLALSPVVLSHTYHY
jgi:hypothetical protein